MNKTDLAASLARRCGMTRQEAEAAVNATFDIITEALSKDEKVLVAGFGCFEVKSRQGRMGRNPRTNEAVEIPAYRAATFRPGKALKEAVEK